MRKATLDSSVPLVVRVGVTGSLRDHPTSSLDVLREKIKDILLLIKTITSKLPESHQDMYSEKIPPELRLISSIGEDIQILAAQEASDLDFGLQFSLPYDREQCRNNLSKESQAIFDRLSTKAVVFELNGDPAPPDEAAGAAGRVILRQCDILVTICHSDPSVSEGKFIEDALALEIPIIWISPSENHRNRLWERDQKTGVAASHESSLEGLRERIEPILLFERGSLEHLHRYRDEQQPSWTLGFLFKLFCRLWVRDWSKPAFRIPDFQKNAESDWEEIWEPLKQTDPNLLRSLKDRFFPEFARADGLADYYANLYRSSFVAAYLMGATAILFAFLGSRGEKNEPYLVVELLLISIIIALTITGRQGGWHERWIDYRVLAEELRQMQFLILFGRVTSSFRIPAHLEESDPRGKWFNWQFRATVRQAGIFNVKLDKPHIEAYRRVILRWIKSQEKYHSTSNTRYKKLHDRLHLTAQGCFIATLVVCVLHLLPTLAESTKIWPSGHHTPEQYQLWLSLGAIVLPALGGALGAILHIGEFERIALRSKALRQKLKGIASQLTALSADASANDLGRVAQDFSEIALDELVDWRFAFIDKELSLPA